MRVLVTGQRGFTGNYVVEALVAAGHQPLAFNADVTDATAVRAAIAAAKPDAVIHLAALAFVAQDAFEPFYAVNQIGTYHLLGAIADLCPGAHVLLASSANLYGNSTAGCLGEDTPPNPANHYGVSKLAMEAGAALWRDRLSIAITRPFNYTGVGQEVRYLVPKIVDHFRRGAAVVELGNIDVKRDFGDVRAVASAYVQLVERRIAGTFNVCSGAVYSVRDVIDMCAQISGVSMRIAFNPAFARGNEVAVLAGDGSRLRAALPGWAPIPLRDTLRWMLTDNARI